MLLPLEWKALPVDSRMVGASAILRRHQEVVWAGCNQRGFAPDRHTPVGLARAMPVNPIPALPLGKQCQPGYRLMRKYNGLNRPACTPPPEEVFPCSNRAPGVWFQTVR